MNIDPRHAPQQGTPGIAGRPSSIVPIEAERVAAPGGRPADRVEISADAQAFQRLRARLEAAADEGRPGRVAALRSALAADAYAPAGEQIAAALLRDGALAGVLGLEGAR